MRILIAAFLLACVWSACCADSIVLNDGSVVEGTIKEQTPRLTRIVVSGIPLTYYADEITRVEKKPIGVSQPESAASEKSVFVESPTPQPMPQDGFLAAGISRAMQGDFDGARAEFEKGLSISVSDENAKSFIAILEDLHNGVITDVYVFSLFKGAHAFLKEDYPEAISEFKKTILIDEKYPAAYRTLGFTYFLTGAYAEAIPVYETLRSLVPDNVDNLINLAYAYSAVGKNAESVEVYTQVIRLYPEFSEAYNNLGSVYIAMGNYDEAIACLQKGIQLDPAIAQMHNNLGTAFSSLGQYEKALVEYKQAIAIDPNLVEAHISEGAVYNSLGNTVRAKDAFIRARAIFEDQKNAAGINMMDALIQKFDAAQPNNPAAVPVSG